MGETTAIFDEAASRADQRPRFILTFADLPTIELTSFPSTAGSKERWGIISKVGSFTGTVKPDEGRSDVSSVTVKVMDDDRFHQIVPLLVRNSQVQLKGGYRNILETDYTVLMTGLLEEPVLDPSLGEWTLRINDLKYFKLNSVFRTFGKTHLNGAIAAGDAVITVDSTNGSVSGDQAFHDPSKPCSGYLLIEDEIIAYTGWNATQFTGCSRGQLPYCGGSAASAHDDDKEVRELLIIYDNPVDIILKMLTSTGTGTNGAYDAWEADQGLGIDVDMVDVAAFEQERDRFLSTDMYLFVLKKPEKCKEFLEKEIHRTINSYPTVTGEGLLSFRLYNPPWAYQPDVLDEDNIAELKKWERGLNDLINNIHFSWDYDVVKGEYMSQRYDLHADSINKHGLSSTWEMQSRGLYSVFQADSLISARAYRMFTRYKDGPVSFEAKVFFGEFSADPGDIRSVTHPGLPDMARGVKGVANTWMEIVSMRPDMAKGAIDLKMMDTRLAGRFCIITPNTYPSYAAATDDQRRHGGFICNAAEQMPNGDDPYLII